MNLTRKYQNAAQTNGMEALATRDRDAWAYPRAYVVWDAIMRVREGDIDHRRLTDAEHAARSGGDDMAAHVIRAAINAIS